MHVETLGLRIEILETFTDNMHRVCKCVISICNDSITI